MTNFLVGIAEVVNIHRNTPGLTHEHRVGIKEALKTFTYVEDCARAKGVIGATGAHSVETWRNAYQAVSEDGEASVDGHSRSLALLNLLTSLSGDSSEKIARELMNTSNRGCNMRKAFAEFDSKGEREIMYEDALRMLGLCQFRDDMQRRIVDQVMATNDNTSPPQATERVSHSLCPLR